MDQPVLELHRPLGALAEAAAVVAREAHALGADGVQFLELIDLKPQSPGEKTAKQIDSAVRIANKAKRGTLGFSDVAEEGSETRWEVRGELVRFTN